MADSTADAGTNDTTENMVVDAVVDRNSGVVSAGSLSLGINLLNIV